MSRLPYTSGDLVLVRLDGRQRRLARVSTILATESILPANRWMLTCRLVTDDRLVDPPLYCGDDGFGRGIRPARPHPGVDPARLRHHATSPCDGRPDGTDPRAWWVADHALWLAGRAVSDRQAVAAILLATEHEPDMLRAAENHLRRRPAAHDLAGTARIASARALLDQALEAATPGSDDRG